MKRSAAEVLQKKYDAIAKLNKKAAERQQQKVLQTSDSDFQQRFKGKKQMPTEHVVMDSDSDFQKSSKGKISSHGGTIHQSIAPEQTTSGGIEFENWKSASGQHFTSLKKLEEARIKKQSKISKKNN